MWHVKPSVLIKDIKKCSNISVGKSPTYSLNFEVFIFKKGLDAISMLTFEIVSSITRFSLEAYLSIFSLFPIAFLNASPNAIETSSIVWCSSISRSPIEWTDKSKFPCFASCSSIWSKYLRPVSILKFPFPSISRFIYMFVSFVDLLINDFRDFNDISLDAKFFLIETAFSWASKLSAFAKIETVGARFRKPSGLAVWKVIILPKSLTDNPEYVLAYLFVGNVWLEPDA